MRLIIVLLSSLTLLACQVKTDDLQQFIAVTKQNTSVNIEPYPQFTTMPPFSYGAQQLRSPFQRPKNLTLQPLATKQANCLQPDYQRQKQALERYGIDALNVTGFFTSRGQPYALFSANDGTLHRATLGDYLGLFYGQITAIENGTITIMEMLPDGAGCWQKKHTTLSMNSAAGEDKNV